MITLAFLLAAAATGRAHAQQVPSPTLDKSPVYFGDCCEVPLRLREADLTHATQHRIYMMIPRDQSPYDVQVSIADPADPTQFKQVSIISRANPDNEAWFTSVHSVVLLREDYSLNMHAGNYDGEAVGENYDNSWLVNWRQSNEYRLVALNVPTNPRDPAFSLIVEDEAYVTISAIMPAKGFIPAVRPTIAFQPANLGISVAGGRRARYRVSAGAGYGIEDLPIIGANSGAQGFLRLQIRLNK